MAPMPGTLFVVATPIGNLEDLSFRALRTLKAVDFIAAEDTRRTAKLLAHYNVRRPMVSLHEHNEHREAARLVARIRTGESAALVSDAGTPGISDPGVTLVREAHRAGVRVTPIPGPTAVGAALSASGLPGDQFLFLGFPPRTGTDRVRWIEEVVRAPRTVVFFEAPHRILRTLAELTAKLVNRQIMIHREITKIHEELVVYTNTYTTETGEYVVVVEGLDVKSQYESDLADRLRLGSIVFDCLTNNSSFEREVAIALASKASEVAQDDLRKAMKKQRISANRAKDRVS